MRVIVYCGYFAISLPFLYVLRFFGIVGIVLAFLFCFGILLVILEEIVIAVLKLLEKTLIFLDNLAIEFSKLGEKTRYFAETFKFWLYHL
jgi:hypothetical protein